MSPTDGSRRNGIPTPDVFETTFTFNGQPSGQMYGVGTVYVTSNVEDESYTVHLVARSTQTGTSYVVDHVQVNGAVASRSNFPLQTQYTDRKVMSTVNDYTISYRYNGNLYSFYVLTRNGQRADECLLVTNEMRYTNGELSFDNRTVSNIMAIRRLDKEQDVTFLMSLPRNMPETGPLYLCINYRMGRAIYTKDFINELMTPYNQLVGTLIAPKIADSSAPPTSVVKMSGMVFQIGTSPISVLEELHKFTFRCALSNAGVPPVTYYSWWKDNDAIVNDNVNYLVSGDTLTIQTTDRSADSAMYTCIADNGVGPIASVFATSSLTITQEVPVTTPVTPTPPPAQPMWVTHPFTSVSLWC